MIEELLVDFDVIMLRIYSEVILVFKKYKQEANNKNESGGVLSGFYLDEYSYRITDASVPTELDRSGKYFFNRAKGSAQSFISKLFKKSKGRKIYLGEWHTHPEDIPTPSYLDIRSIKKQIKTVNLNTSRIFLVIVGRKKTYLGIYDTKGNLIVENHIII
ncbi:hypothetical protein G6R40_02490 [Chryseobacterium sp. POL2]|uniref:Mov34/MPN/PAD-1 family protein n=1 Tax=Chryseobacterium sp. POL2 TaxID=2713414 RepID=UPI0013E18A2E|nr:Mov34/MPN/PAD-1 family protein [Chryseobacterium sp. POL2]QIG88513.1 hypothetical protein G6R40_02040 [Chryseobacterium sp. POL2]QIG88600.1 hypothetical protein G6R40_02490 [Chryseobacterium sp. POL2]